MRMRKKTGYLLLTLLLLLVPVSAWADGTAVDDQGRREPPLPGCVFLPELKENIWKTEISENKKRTESLSKEMKYRKQTDSIRK